MKYLKTFENSNENDIVKLAIHTCKTFTYTIGTNEYIKIDYNYNTWTDKYNIFNNIKNDDLRSYLFSFNLIDYCIGDNDRYFEFEKPRNFNYLFELEINIIEFIEMIVNKYTKSNNMISFSVIPKMIDDINIDNFNIFVESKKYNL